MFKTTDDRYVRWRTYKRTLLPFAQADKSADGLRGGVAQNRLQYCLAKLANNGVALKAVGQGQDEANFLHDLDHGALQKKRGGKVKLLCDTQSSVAFVCNTCASLVLRCDSPRFVPLAASPPESWREKCRSRIVWLTAPGMQMTHTITQQQIIGEGFVPDVPHPVNWHHLSPQAPRPPGWRSAAEPQSRVLCQQSHRSRWPYRRPLVST